jgi:hypothetical protein
MFESTGSVVRAGIVAETAANPFRSFSRVMDSFIRNLVGRAMEKVG